MKLVLFALASRCDANTLECFPSRALLAQDTGLHESSVKRTLVYLETTPLLVRWRRKRNDGTLAGWHYRLVIDGALPEGWRLASDTPDEGPDSEKEKSPTKQRGVTVTPRKKSKRKSAEASGHSEPAAGHCEPTGGHSDPTLSTHELPTNSPHPQADPQSSPRVYENSSTENLDHPSATATEATNKIFDQWPADSRRITRKQLSALVIEWELKTGRNPLLLAAAAKAYLTVHRATPGKISWLRAWFDREEYQAHLSKPLLPPPPRETADDRTRWDAYFDEAMRAMEFDPPDVAMGLSFWAAPPAAWLRAFGRSPNMKVAGYLRKKLGDLNRAHYPWHFKAYEMLEALPHHMRKLRDSGEWPECDWPDPREKPDVFPGWLLSGWGVAPDRASAAA